jgi:uncharacterized protein
VSHQFSPPQPDPRMYAPGLPVAKQGADVRQRFMTRVYLHLLLAIGGFIGVEFLLFEYGIAESIATFVFQTNWLVILGGFMVVSWMAGRMSAKALSPGAAYGGLALLVVANALLFAAPLYIANETAEGTISTAAWLSLGAFAALSGIAITTSRDFSFLRGVLMWGGVLALCLIVGSVLFGAALGTWFAVAMIGFAGAAILYDTQKIYHSYPPDREVVAAMSLFSSLALLFWYVLQLLMRR